MRMLLGLSMLLLMLCGCPSRSVPATQSPTGCEACLASGKNWTGGTCQPTCLQDTDCYGPGNAAAPTCPKN